MKHRYWLILVSLLVTAAAITGCQRGGSSDLADIGVDLTISPDPPQIGQTMIFLTLNDANGQPISEAEVELEGNMNHAGMAPVFAEAVETAPGQYQAPLEFTMGGDWFILVKATLPDGRKMERQIDVPGVSSQ